MENHTKKLLGYSLVEYIGWMGNFGQILLLLTLLYNLLKMKNKHYIRGKFT